MISSSATMCSTSASHGRAVAHASSSRTRAQCTHGHGTPETRSRDGRRAGSTRRSAITSRSARLTSRRLHTSTRALLGDQEVRALFHLEGNKSTSRGVISPIAPSRAFALDFWERQSGSSARPKRQTRRHSVDALYGGTRTGFKTHYRAPNA